MCSKLSKQNRPILMRNREHTFAGWDADLLRLVAPSGALNARSLLVSRLFKRAFGPQGDASRARRFQKGTAVFTLARHASPLQIRLVPTSWGSAACQPDIFPVAIGIMRAVVTPSMAPTELAPQSASDGSRPGINI